VSKTTQTGDTTRAISTPQTTLNWGDTPDCDSCHGNPPNYPNGATTWGGTAKANSHSAHTTHCETCHNGTTTTGDSITGTALHTNKTYNIAAGNGEVIGSYTYNDAGGSCADISCHGGVGINNAQWGTSLDCTTCHDKDVNSPRAAALNAAVTTRANVVGEFGQAWGHKKTGRGAVTDADCIVCHLEGDYTTQKTSALHADGYIDMRDPDVSGETRITDISGTSFRFVQFATSYAAGSRTSTGHTSNNVDNVLTQKFCLACHDSDGATNTTARAISGTAFMPWGGSTGYTVTNGATAANGLIDVKIQFATSNSSAHPVLGPRSKDFPTAARFIDPYKPTGTRGTSGTLSQGVVINCFDCHNAPTPLTTRTVVAHGSNATDYLRGVATVTGTPSSTNAVTLCVACHDGYTGAGQSHGADSAFNSSTRASMAAYVGYGCNYCHSSSETAIRPFRAEDIHGNNRLRVTDVNDLMWPVGATETNRPYAFIRNASTTITGSAASTVNYTTYRPLTAGTELTSGSPSCQTTGTSPCSNMSSLRTYTPGGAY
jgi:hypothetical protein